MSPDKEKFLRRTYPNLYRPTYNGACMTFECHDGWFDLLKCLSEKLETMIEPILQDDEFDEWSPHAIQVKEKFGTLRFYMNLATEEMFKVVDEYESMSETICEICGEAGTFSRGTWYSVRCEDHRLD